MTKLVIAAVALIPVLAACKKTGDGQYEVDKPVVGVQKDTLNVPQVEAKMEEKQVEIPKLEVKKETTTVKVPDVDVKKN